MESHAGLTRVSGSRILGLGDLGVNGKWLSLALAYSLEFYLISFLQECQYRAGNLPFMLRVLGLFSIGRCFTSHGLMFSQYRIRPTSTIPICLDLGTNNQKYLDDPLYLGLRQKRVSSEVMTEFMEEFMDEMHATFPKLLVQFEDFSTDNAFLYLEKFRFKFAVFNDDINGTGAVVLSGFINAAKLSSAASGQPLTSHRILFLGAGSAGVGVATQLMSFFTLHGLTTDEARERIYLVDSQGLVFDGRGPLAEHKKCWWSLTLTEHYLMI